MIRDLFAFSRPNDIVLRLKVIVVFVVIVFCIASKTAKYAALDESVVRSGSVSSVNFRAD